MTRHTAVRPVWAASNVSVRTREDAVGAIGFLALCLAQQPDVVDLEMEDVFADPSDASSSAASVAGSLSRLDLLDATATAATDATVQAPPINAGPDVASPSSDTPLSGTAGAEISATNAKPPAPHPQPNAVLVWFPKSSLQRRDMQHLREAVSRSRFARPPPVLPTRPFPNAVSLPSSLNDADPLDIPHDAIFIHLASITWLSMTPVLTLSTGGHSACLIKLVLTTASPANAADSFENKSAATPASTSAGACSELWFELDESLVAAKFTDVHFLLDWWLASVGFGLRSIAPPADRLIATSSDDANVVGKAAETADDQPKDDPNTAFFEVIDRAELVAAFESAVSASGSDAVSAAGASQREWPVSLPISQNSMVYKLGAFGLGVAASIVGPSISNKVEDVARTAAWDVMERFSRVTRFAQSTTRQVVEHPLARPILPLIPTRIRDFILTSEEAEALISEYDSAGHYMAYLARELQGRLRGSGDRPTPIEPPAVIDKTRDFECIAIGKKSHRTKEPVTAEQWISLYDETGALTISELDAKKRIFYSGLEDDARCEAWKFLLKTYPWDSTEKERQELVHLRKEQYENMKAQWMSILNDASAAAVGAGVPIVDDLDTMAGDEREDGDVVSKIKERKYRVEKDVVRTDRTVAFFGGEAVESSSSSSSTAASLVTQPPERFSKNLQMLKDVLITYTIYNFELGYVQGMNDLLAPLLAVVQDEVEAFWCFAEFMESMKSNFYRDQSGMRRQLHQLGLLIQFVDPPLYAHLDRIDSANLFCCFRWLLVLFKREFDFEDIKKIWE
ncbi:GTPase activating protein, partial [Cladochytrium tenue]